MRRKSSSWLGAAVVAAVVALVTTSCSGGGGDPQAFCTTLRAQLPALTANTSDPKTGPVVLAAFETVGKVAPGAIKGDWQRLVKLIDKVVKSDPNDANAYSADFSAALDPSVNKAAANVVKYAKTTCSIDLNAAGAASSPTTTTA